MSSRFTALSTHSPAVSATTKRVLKKSAIPIWWRNRIPTCKACGGTLKPDVILFGEQMPIHPWRAAEHEINQCDLLIVVGSSLEVNPVAKLPFDVLANGGKLIIINQQITYINARADIVFREDAAEVLPAILEAIKNGE